MNKDPRTRPFGKFSGVWVPAVGHATLHIDGGCRPTNPGPSAIACVINLTNSVTRETTEYVLARPTGIKTNNQVEYMALIVGIKYAQSLGASGLEIYTDSKLILHQMKNEWYVRELTLFHLRHEARALLESYYKGHWELIWIPRKDNARADAICTEAILCNNPWIPNLRDPFRRPRRRNEHKWKYRPRGWTYDGSLR